MYFVVAGGGEVGYHLSKALLEAGHEVMIIERDRRRALWIEEQRGSVVINAPADEGRYQIQAGCQRADAVLAVTGDGEDNRISSQRPKLKCGATRVLSRVTNPKR